MGEFDDLKTQYQTQADKFINEINATIITVYFPTQQSSSITNPIPNKPNNLSSLGGRTSYNELQDRFLESGENRQISPEPIQLKVRVYWENVDDDLTDQIRDRRNQCKIICFSSQKNTLLSADYIEVDTLKCKRIGSEEFHGLFGDKRYMTTYWEVIN